MGDRTKGCDKTKGFKTCFVRYDQGDMIIRYDQGDMIIKTIVFELQLMMDMMIDEGDDNDSDDDDDDNDD